MSAKAPSNLGSSSLEEVRRGLREYELKLDRSKRKRLGQFFTGSKASSLLAAMCLQGAEQSVVDPMAGHGDLLDAVATRSAKLKQSLRLSGVEIDPPTAAMAEQRLGLCGEIGGHRVEVLAADAFDAATWRRERAPGSFDVVIANPPYVRYQSTSSSRRLHAGATTEPRAGLLKVLGSMPDGPEHETWVEVVKGYSGLADLSVPSWVLCSLLVRPGGLVGLVVPKTWMNRDYARVIQYIQLRFFEPVAVVEEHGVGWFEDALVPTTLVISRRLEAADAAVPIGERRSPGRETVVVSIPAELATESSLVGSVFRGSDPDGSFASWLRKGAAENIPGLTVRRLGWGEQRTAVLSRCARERWLRAIGERTPRAKAGSQGPSVVVPRPLLEAVGQSTVSTTSLESLGLEIGQGLRTGCNAFFYVEELGPGATGTTRVRVSEALGNVEVAAPASVLRPVVRRQRDVAAFQVDPLGITGRALDLRGWALPEDQDDAGSLLQTVPEELAMVLRRAARTVIGSSENGSRIPELTAVRTNVRPGSRNGSLFGGMGLPRFWYTLPDFAPRHTPMVFVPRVNMGTPWFISNPEPPLLVDANFSALYGDAPRVSWAAVLALLNSTWCRACTEYLGTPMGGGALKLEATQLRHLPVPVVGAEALVRLDALGRALIATRGLSAPEVLQDIDRVVFSVLRGRVLSESVLSGVGKRFQRLLAESQSRRSRSPRERVG